MAKGYPRAGKRRTTGNIAIDKLSDDGYKGLDGTGFSNLTAVLKSVKETMDSVGSADPVGFCAEAKELCTRSGITLDEEDKADVVTFVEANFNVQNIPKIEMVIEKGITKEKVVGTKTPVPAVVKAFWP